jgi:hypothetical protein
MEELKGNGRGFLEYVRRKTMNMKRRKKSLFYSINSASEKLPKDQNSNAIFSEVQERAHEKYVFYLCHFKPPLYSQYRTKWSFEGMYNMIPAKYTDSNRQEI